MCVNKTNVFNCCVSKSGLGIDEKRREKRTPFFRSGKKKRGRKRGMKGKKGMSKTRWSPGHE